VSAGFHFGLGNFDVSAGFVSIEFVSPVTQGKVSAASPIAFEIVFRVFVFSAAPDEVSDQQAFRQSVRVGVELAIRIW